MRYEVMEVHMSLVWFRSTRNAKASRRTTSLIIAHIERYALPSRLPCLSLSLSIAIDRPYASAALSTLLPCSAFPSELVLFSRCARTAHVAEEDMIKRESSCSDLDCPVEFDSAQSHMLDRCQDTPPFPPLPWRCHSIHGRGG